MSATVTATLPGYIRNHLEGRLPPWLDVRWFKGPQQALELVGGAEIGWLDTQHKPDMAAAIEQAGSLRWLHSIYAGVDGIPLQTLMQRGVRLTNGAGLSAVTMAEYVLMGMLTIAKGWRTVVAAQQRHEWLATSPGVQELAGTRALILGYGSIGQRVAQLLRAFEVQVSPVRRHPDRTTGELGPDDWRARLGEFDWIILAVPATPETDKLIGAAELAAMAAQAVLLNVARGAVVDQAALVRALTERRIAGAFLDVTEPEPLPPEHPLWALDNCHISMHLSGRAQTQSFARAAQRFLDNLARYRAGQPLLHQVDLALGY